MNDAKISGAENEFIDPIDMGFKLGGFSGVFAFICYVTPEFGNDISHLLNHFSDYLIDASAMTSLGAAFGYYLAEINNYVLIRREEKSIQQIRYNSLDDLLTRDERPFTWDEQL